jgi:chloramphenicol-sensitive protein RarD
LPTATLTEETKKGIINALAAYVMWGFAPIYFKLLQGVDASEILMHRIVWSCVLLLIIVVVSNKWQAVKSLIQQPKMIARLALSSIFLAINWFMFIWAINNDHLLDASLGYFINPLFSVALGMIFLNEKLRKWQWFAVFLAIVGVVVQFIALGSLPVISFVLAGSFGIYGLLRKQMHVDSLIGLLIESMLMLPIALVFWWFFVNSATGNMFHNTWSLNSTLIFAGVITTAPLLCFTTAAKKLTLTVLGFFQYVGPSLMFILAIVIYNEPLQVAKLTTFFFIWSALFVFSFDSYRARRKFNLNNKKLA